MFASNIGPLGIDADFPTDVSDFELNALDQVVDSLPDQGFVKVIRTNEHLQAAREVWSQFEWVTRFVVLGTGGSYNGAKALQSALQIQDPEVEVIFAGNTSDPHQIEQLLRKLDLSTTVFNVISKSGETLEPLAQYLYFKQQYIDNGEDWVKHFIFTTNSVSGALLDEANRFSVATLSLPHDVPGRFSVLTGAGLLPALAMGIDIEQLIEGAATYLQELVDEPEQSISWQLAWQQFMLSEGETEQDLALDVVILWIYAERLKDFGSWFSQLWAESLGKEGRGILPLIATGPADHHSLLQSSLAGTNLASHLSLGLREHSSDYRLSISAESSLSEFDNQSFVELLHSQRQSVHDALHKAGKPIAMLDIAQLDAKHMGSLFMMFEISVVLLAELLKVNAFNQPAVDDTKKLLKKYL